MQLDARLIEGFTEAVLKQRYDEPVQTPQFHREMWTLACDERIQHLALAAPREHAKSTGLTHAFGLAASLFGFRDYTVIVSDTEGQSVKFLGDIKMELQENELLIKEFGVEDFLKDSETEIIVKCAAGLFNITAKGAEQKVRGLKWRGKRPNLILADDLENDELVMNKDRRDKLRTWFLTALLPCGSKRCLFRVVGTVLHLDSVLNRLLEDPTWTSRRWAAHSPDFSQILWPEKFDRPRLEQIRARFISQGKPEKYSQEYLNQPVDESTAYFQRDWFLFHTDEERRLIDRGQMQFRYIAAVDIAVSTKESADWTVITIAGVDSQGRLHILDIRRGRWESLDTVEKMFTIQSSYAPELFCVEKGPLNKAFLPFLNAEMLKRGHFLNLHHLPCAKDKRTRARSFQAKMKAGGVIFAHGDWLPDAMSELLQFDRGKHDDIVDTMSLLGQALDDFSPAATEEEVEQEIYYREADASLPDGRSEICGY